MELAKLKEKMAAMMAEKSKMEATIAVGNLISESKLPKEAVTEVFTEQLLAADEAGRKRLLEDRQAIWKVASGGRQASSGARSKEQSLAEQQGSTTYTGTLPNDGKSFAAALRG